ncbi:shikimate transporter ShiA domain protein [Rhodococcus sp. MTM3W5.2]|nr:shikimate transporter ShiA domain protein [Rhodococcus sp. MTM3W5.2]
MNEKPEHRPGPAAAARSRVAMATLAGTTLEWYDFFLYGTAAALIFNKQFFPSLSPSVGTLAAFSTFAVGFIARPLAAWCSGTSVTASVARRHWSYRW